MAFRAPGQFSVDFRNLPRGAQGYSMVRILSGGHVCTRSMEYFSQGPGKPPRIESKTSGNCSGGPEQTFPRPDIAACPQSVAALA
jgi:hypothetical protein